MKIGSNESNKKVMFGAFVILHTNADFGKIDANHSEKKACL